MWMPLWEFGHCKEIRLHDKSCITKSFHEYKVSGELRQTKAMDREKTEILFWYRFTQRLSRLSHWQTHNMGIHIGRKKNTCWRKYWQVERLTSWDAIQSSFVNRMSETERVGKTELSAKGWIGLKTSSKRAQNKLEKASRCVRVVERNA